MAELKIHIVAEFDWKKEDGDCSECAGCKDLIFGNKYTWSAKLNGKGKDIFSVSVCESCKVVMDEDANDNLMFYLD